VGGFLIAVGVPYLSDRLTSFGSHLKALDSLYHHFLQETGIRGREGNIKAHSYIDAGRAFLAGE